MPRAHQRRRRYNASAAARCAQRPCLKLSLRSLRMTMRASMGTAVPPPRQLLQTMRPLPRQVEQPPSPSLHRLHQHSCSEADVARTAGRREQRVCTRRTAASAKAARKVGDAGEAKAAGLTHHGAAAAARLALGARPLVGLALRGFGGGAWGVSAQSRSSGQGGRRRAGCGGGKPPWRATRTPAGRWCACPPDC